jgi:hypothetical protein
MLIRLFLLLMLATNAEAALELSSPGRNIGIGTTSTKNALSVLGGVAIGDIAFTMTTAPTQGLIVKGNVGIGTAAANVALKVLGTVAATAYTGDGSALTGISTQWATQNTTDVSIAGGNVGIGTTKTTTAAMTIMNGNVGIGTWKPTEALEVLGTASVNQLSLRGTGPYKIFGTAVQIDPNNSSGTGLTPKVNIDTAGNLGIGSTAATTSRVTVFTGDLEFKEAGKGIKFQDGTTQTSASSSGGWTDAGAVLYNTTTTDNVGIGSSVADATLEIVKQGTAPILAVSSTPSGNGNYFLVANGGNIGMGTLLPEYGMVVTTNGAAYKSISSVSVVGAGVGIGTTLTTNAALAVMSGNVGIGTWKPAAALDIVGALKATSIGVGTYAVCTVSGNCPGSGGSGTPGGNSAEPQYNSSGSFAGLPRGVMTSGGNVGLGTTTVPSGTFEVTKNSTDDIILASSTGSVSGDYFIVKNGGNVGVGTTSPQAKLVVMGNVGIGTWTASGPLNIAGVTQFVFNSANVGIGSTSPTADLDVTKHIRMNPTDSPSTCNTNFTGALYYDASLAEMCDCNGSSWAQVDGGGAC